MSIYDLAYTTPQGITKQLADYKGKVLLIVNTATKCGFTYQFNGLEELHQKYSSKGLVVIGFPCNQFLNQEPETNENMEEVCKMNHGVTFQLTEKIDVNGKNTHPVFRYLKHELTGILLSRIKWNFTKFLISSDGTPHKRYAPTVKPEEMEADIITLLNRGQQ